MRRTLILLASLAIIVLGLWGSAVIFLDEERLKSIVTGHMSVQSGRKVDIRGSLSLRLFPRPRIHAQDLVVAAPDGFDGPGLLSADELVMSVRLLPLVRGSLTPREVRLSGATINLYTDEMGSSSVDGLLRLPDAGIRRGAERLATRQMRLEDIRVVINDMSVGRRHVLNMDLVEFDRFAFDEPLEFRFRGNLGDPPVFSMMDIEGLLLVPSTRERPVRLSNMRLTGVLSGSDLPLYLLGHVSMSSVPYFRLELGDGTLDVDGQQLSIDSTYTGSERGHLEVTANADRLALGRDTVRHRTAGRTVAAVVAWHRYRH
jgi:AsmA protein